MVPSLIPHSKAPPSPPEVTNLPRRTVEPQSPPPGAHTCGLALGSTSIVPVSLLAQILIPILIWILVRQILVKLRSRGGSAAPHPAAAL